jgi:hypothetical protein
VTFNVAFVKNCRVYYREENDDFSPSSNHGVCYECENLLMVPIYINCLEFDFELVLIPSYNSHNLFFVGNLGTHFKFSFCYKTKNQQVFLPLTPFNKHKGVLRIEFFPPSSLMHFYVDL